jgi:hypothetical protein
MRVPKLGWPDDLFQDVVPEPDLPMTIAAQFQMDARKPLWTVMRGVWMAGPNADRGVAGITGGRQPVHA